MSFEQSIVKTDDVYCSLVCVYEELKLFGGQASQYCEVDTSVLLLSGEKSFVKLFYNILQSRTQSIDKGISIADDYLKACDIFPVVYRISNSLRNFFKMKVFFTPGLFKTSLGIGYLREHQLSDLNRMTQIENDSLEFEAMRGGILSGEPGEGNAVTCLALLVSTAGTLPILSLFKQDDSTIEFYWSINKADKSLPTNMMLDILRKASNDLDMNTFSVLKNELKNVSSFVDTYEMFREKVKSAILKAGAHCPMTLDRLWSKYRFGIKRIRDHLCMTRQQRVADMTDCSPNSLFPSSATLIIVPEALLEHWFEQIKCHLNLKYFVRDSRLDCRKQGTDGDDCRGVGYFCGLGDIIDLKSPLDMLHKAESGESMSACVADMLPHYLIVITTFERCAMELKNKSTINRVPILRIRWLRLVIDEGHYIDEPVSIPASAHIAQITAERRWVVTSGTQISANSNEEALSQLFRWLTFLKHPILTQYLSHQQSRRVFNNDKRLVSVKEWFAGIRDEESNDKIPQSSKPTSQSNSRYKCPLDYGIK